MANANIKAVITAEDRTGAVLSGFSSKMQGMGLAVAGAVKNAGIALGIAGAAAVGFGVKSASSFEQTRIGLENMLGSADKAKSLLADISKFAAETPFEFPELAQATRQLVAFGFSGEEAFDTMKQLGDVSAAVGAPINDLAYLMGTLKTQGRAFTIDIRQFAQRGIPIYEYLAKVLHTNEQEISKMIEAGKIGFPEVQKAFQAMTGAGGKFNGTMAKQSQSMAGLFSTLKDNLGQTLRTMVGITNEGDIIKGSLFDMMKNGLQELMPKLQAFGEKVGPFLQNAVRNTSTAISDLINSFKEPKLGSDGIGSQMEKIGSSARKVYDVLKKTLGPSLEALGKTLQKDLLPTLKRMAPYLDDIAKILGGIIVAALWLFINYINISIKVWSSFTNAVITTGQIIRNVILGIASIITFLNDTIAKTWQTLRDATASAWQFIFDNVIKPIVDLIIGYFRLIGTVVEYVWGWVNALTMVAWNWLYNNAINPVLTWISSRVTEVGNIIINIWNWIAARAGEVWNFIRNIAGATWDWIVGKWQTAIGWFSGIWQGIANSLGGPANSIRGIFSGVMEDVKGIVKGSINWIIRQINSMIDGVNKVADKVPGAPKMGTIPYLAKGTTNFGGGLAVVGEQGPELVSLPRGSSVYSNDKSKEMMGGTVNITIQAGAFMGSQQDARKYAEMIMNAWNDLQATRGMAT